MILAITYDLNKPDKDYEGLYNAIKAEGIWWHFLDSFWLLDTVSTPDQVSGQLVKKIDPDDRLLVIRVTSQYQGFLSEEAWAWIRERVF